MYGSVELVAKISSLFPMPAFQAVPSINGSQCVGCSRGFLERSMHLMYFLQYLFSLLVLELLHAGIYQVVNGMKVMG